MAIFYRHKCILLRIPLVCKCLCTKGMSREDLDAFFAPLSSVRGLTVLDPSLFTRDIEVPAIKLAEASQCSKFMKYLSHVILRYPFVKKVVNLSEKDGKESKALLLLPEALRPLPLSSSDHEWILANKAQMTTHTVRLTYPESYSHAAILKAMLPEDVKEVPNGFEAVGHIAHFNLKEEVMTYKNIIGQVTLDKHKLIKTVVNKTDKIDTTFRFFSMEVLAGERDLIATLSENGCSFTFDFSKVYWNSRLHSEHKRIVDILKSGEIVLDVFAGVGPFALPAAKKGCIVHANDLNPHSHEYLCENVKKNKLERRVHSYNMDGREFIRKITKQFVDGFLETKGSMYSHVLMNLPATAHTFLDTFKGLFSQIPESKRSTVILPTIHCYGFSKSEDSPESDSLRTVTNSLGVEKLSNDTYSLSVVRKVAPSKTMTRVSFQLPGEVAYAVGGDNSANESEDLTEPLPKRTKLD